MTTTVPDPPPPLALPRRLIDANPALLAVEKQGGIIAAPPIDGWDWLRPTVIAGRRYDWWQHTDGRLRLAPSLLDALEGGHL